MEILSQCVSHAKLPLSFESRSSLYGSNSVPKIVFKNSFQKQLEIKQRGHKKLWVVLATSDDDDQGIPPQASADRWLLEPVEANYLSIGNFGREQYSTFGTYINGNTWYITEDCDGNYKHIGFKVAMPGAFEVASDEIIVGRLPEKADMVISVATVSAQHAVMRKKGGNLFVTDLDSTNGTFIDEKRLRPGIASLVLPGSCVTFGDIHLAIFRASKVKPDLEAPQQEDTQASTNPIT